MAMFAFALTIPTPLKTSPRMLCSMYPKTCSTRQRTFDFFRFDSFTLARIYNPSLSNIRIFNPQTYPYIIYNELFNADCKSLYLYVSDCKSDTAPRPQNIPENGGCEGLFYLFYSFDWRLYYMAVNCLWVE